MFGSLFGSRKSVSLRDFLTQVKAGKRDFFEVLHTPENHFEDASFEQLMSNTDDVLAEVNRVQKNFRDTYFGLFDGCLIKHHDNGDVKWIFYTTTKDAKTVLDTAGILYAELGSGYYDESISVPFLKRDQVTLLAQGLTSAVEQDIHSIWLHEGVTVFLQYKKDPLRQLSLMVTIKKPKEKDTAIRRRTILELIQRSLDEVFAGRPSSVDKEYQDGDVKFSDVVYSVEKPIMGVFNRVRVRQFGDHDHYSLGTDANLTLYASRPIAPEHKIGVVEKLIQLYEADWSSTTELSLHEREKIESRGFWTGRNWSFNEQHGLHDMNNPDEKMSYWLSVDDFEDEHGFKVAITGYNNLIELFGAS